MNKMHQALFYFNAQGEIRPELVQASYWDEARMEISLELKKGVRFANGKLLHSRDIVATLELLKNPAYGYPYRADLNFIETITAMDHTNFRIKLRERFAPWKGYLTFKILNAADIRGLTAGQFRKHIPLGCGPYQLAVVKEQRAIALRENPYYIPQNSIKKIEYTVLRDARQGPLKLLTAEMDAVEIQADDQQAYRQLRRWQKNFQLLKYKKFGYTYLVFNLKNSSNDMALRRLFYNHLTRSPFLDIFLKGAGEKVHSPFLFFSGTAPVKSVPAVALRQPRRLRILTNTESVLRKQLVLFLCEEMKPFRVELEPEFVEYQTFLNYLKQGNYDLAVSAFLLDMDWNMKDILSSTGYFNYAGLADVKMDGLLERGLREMDEKKRRQIYLGAHECWLESLPIIPLFTLDYFMGISRSVRIPDNCFRLIGSTGDFFYNFLGW